MGGRELFGKRLQAFETILIELVGDVPEHHAEYFFAWQCFAIGTLGAQRVKILATAIVLDSIGSCVARRLRR